MACELLINVLLILVHRLFVPLNLRVTLVTLYQGPPTPGDSIPAASSRRPCGVTAAESRVARPPVGDLLPSLRIFFGFIIPARFFGRFDIRF